MGQSTQRPEPIQVEEQSGSIASPSSHPSSSPAAANNMSTTNGGSTGVVKNTPNRNSGLASKLDENLIVSGKRSRKKVNRDTIYDQLTTTPANPRKRKASPSNEESAPLDDAFQTPSHAGIRRGSPISEAVKKTRMSSEMETPTANPVGRPRGRKKNHASDKVRLLREKLAILEARKQELLKKSISPSPSARKSKGTPTGFGQGGGDFVPSSPVPSFLSPTNLERTSSRSGRKIKTPMSLTASSSEAVKLDEYLKKGREALNKLMKHNWAIVFNTPVDYKAMSLFNYPDIIAYPMDLGTVMQKLKSGAYPDLESLHLDVELVWANAMVYNGPTHDVYTMALTLKLMFDKSMEKIPEQVEKILEQKRIRAEQQAAQKAAVEARKEKAKAARPSSVKRRQSTSKKKTPKQPAKIRELEATVSSMKKNSARRSPIAVAQSPLYDAGGQPLTYREKEDLKKAIVELGNANQEHVVKVVNIIKQSPYHQGSNEEDEDMEVDIELLDVRTLRNLQAYVETTNRELKRGRLSFGGAGGRTPLQRTGGFSSDSDSSDDSSDSDDDGFI